ncbi:hypothetical protein ACTXT7_000427 [Hymenolepis weldensis]
MDQEVQTILPTWPRSPAKEMNVCMSWHTGFPNEMRPPQQQKHSKILTEMML